MCEVGETMADIRENLGWLIGSIATALAIIVAWFIKSGVVISVFMLLIGQLIGAGISIFVRKRTLKMEWKREYFIKTAEEVYDSLFSNIKRIIMYLENRHYTPLHFNWGEIQDSHRYFMVDEKFRDKLDLFLEQIKSHNEAVNKLRNKILPNIIIEAAENIFEMKVDIRNITPRIEYKEGSSDIAMSHQTVELLLSNLHPKEYILKYYPEAIFSKFIIQIHTPHVSINNIEDKSIKFWELCLTKMGENKTYQNVNKNHKKLLEEAKGIRKLLIERIQEIWKL